MENSLSEIIIALKKIDISQIDEAKLKQSTILHIFSTLGWDIFNHNEVTPEFSIENKNVDYALMVNARPKVIVEVKRPGENIGNHQEQLLNYAFLQGISLAVLTNGLTWWFYLPLLPEKWDQKKYDSIDIIRDDTESIVRKIIDYLSKPNISTDMALKIAKKTYRNNKRKQILDITFPQAWDIVVNPLNPDFVEQLNSAIEEVSGFRASQESLEKYIISKRRTPIILPEKPISIRAQPATNDDKQTASYWIISVAEADSINRLIKNENVWAFGQNTGGRRSLKPGDYVCFYLSKKGIVAHARARTSPTYYLHDKVKTPEKYPWVFELSNIEVYLSSPTAINKEKRQQLDGFRGKNPSAPWGWFVQGAHTVTQNDFYKLIKTN